MNKDYLNHVIYRFLNEAIHLDEDGEKGGNYMDNIMKAPLEAIARALDQGNKIKKEKSDSSFIGNHPNISLSNKNNQNFSNKETGFMGRVNSTIGDATKPTTDPGSTVQTGVSIAGMEPNMKTTPNDNVTDPRKDKTKKPTVTNKPTPNSPPKPSGDNNSPEGKIYRGTQKPPISSSPKPSGKNNNYSTPKK